GMFINTLPIRLRLADKSVKASLSDAFDQLSELLLHEHASLGLALKCSGVQAPAPLFTTLLNFRHTHLPSNTDGRGFDGIAHLGGHERTNYPIIVSVDDLGSGFAVSSQCVGGID